MLVTAAATTSAVVGVIGSLILWSNPNRSVNRTVFTCSLHVSAWLLCLQTSFVSKENGLFWLRWACAVGASMPFHLWIVQESIARTETFDFRSFIKRSCILALTSGALTYLPFTDFFIPSHSTATDRKHGLGYPLFMLGLFLQSAYLLFQTFRSAKILTGSRRLELQVWLLGGSAVLGVVMVLMMLNSLTQDLRIVRLQPVVVLVFYVGTVVTITTNRIFNARQVVIVCVEKGALVSLSAALAYFLDYGLAPLLPNPLNFLFTTAITLWFAASLNGWLNRAFQFYPQATSARQAAFAAAGKEAQLERLEGAFLSILKGWGQSEHALVMSGTLGCYVGGAVELAAEDSEASLMRQIRWATPERLARERPTPARLALAKFLSDHHLGVLVASEGPTLNALVGVGVPASRRPFTYPQVTQLLELAAIIENALERAHLSAKAQHAEQLATVGLLGASLAHEIRNPLVSIKTFVQLLPNHYHDQAFRDKFFRLISDEVTRIDRLTEQLLDLASPRVYSAKLIELHAVLRESVDLVAAKATGKNVELRSDFQASPDIAHADPAAVKQVLLNLCFNAIQAVETQFGERWVKITTRNSGPNIELSISDSGPGISPAIWPKLFQPFQSTKSSGFGLGLAICKDILTNLNATISVDQPTPGLGATFRVTFPCRP